MASCVNAGPPPPSISRAGKYLRCVISPRTHTLLSQKWSRVSTSINSKVYARNRLSNCFSNTSITVTLTHSDFHKLILLYLIVVYLRHSEYCYGFQDNILLTLKMYGFTYFTAHLHLIPIPICT